MSHWSWILWVLWIMYTYIYIYWYWYCGLNIFEYIWWILWTFAVSQFGCRIPLIFTRLPHTASSRVGIKTTAFVPTGPARLLETNSHDNIKIYQAHHKNRYQWTNERNERGCNLALNCSHLETQTRLTRLSDSQTRLKPPNRFSDSEPKSLGVWKWKPQQISTVLIKY